MPQNMKGDMMSNPNTTLSMNTFKKNACTIFACAGAAVGLAIGLGSGYVLEALPELNNLPSFQDTILAFTALTSMFSGTLGGIGIGYVVKHYPSLVVSPE